MHEGLLCSNVLADQISRNRNRHRVATWITDHTTIAIMRIGTAADDFDDDATRAHVVHFGSFTSVSAP